MKKYLLLFFSLLLVGALSAQQYRLVFPKDSFVTSNLNINFSWSKVDNATSYELQIAGNESFSAVLFQPSNIIGTSYTQLLTIGNTYYWRIRAYVGGNAQAWSYSRCVSIFSPTQFSGLVMWFDAAQNVTHTAGAISQWNDLSPSGLVATQTSTANKPTLVSTLPQLCNKPVVRFDGTGVAPTADYLTFSTINLTEYTALMVRNYTSVPALYMQYLIGGPQCGLCAESNYYGGGFGTYSSLQGANALYASSPLAQVSGFGIFSTQRNHIYRNGIESSPTVSLAPPNDFATQSIPGLALTGLGTRPDNPILSYRGDVGEILLYDNSLDTNSRKLAEKYLRHKFAPPIDLGPDTIVDRFCVNINISSSSCFSSYLWSTGATTASINVTSIGTYSVRAIDIFGFVSYDTIHVRPQIAFNQLPQNVFLCAGDSIIWNTGYPATGYQFTWSPVANTPSIVIKTPGNYSVAIKDAFNCTFNSAVVQVTVDNFPNYSLGADTSFCSGNRLNFVYPDPLTSILWSNDDTVREPIITAPGNYSVIAVNNNGCIAKDTIGVSISGYAPTVKFGNPILCATDTILFIDSTEAPAGNSIVWWTWNFGSGDTSNLQNVAYVFSTSGVYPVSLTAYTDSGCLNTVTKNLQVYLKPQAHFQAKVSCALAQTQFIDLSDTTSSSIGQWKWHFTNADSSFFKNPTFAFPTQGKYEVSLKVTNNNGCSDFISDSIEVFAPFSADFNFENVCFDDSTSFTDITSSLSLVSWLWNTGDNFFSTKKNFKHKYATFGNKTVTLQIQNAIGCVDSVSKSFFIYKSPIAAFTDLVSCEDQYYTPLDASTVYETANTWKWNIAGTNYIGLSPQHFLADTGNYTVKLLITSQSGCKDSTNHLVHITPNPSAAFTFTPIYGDAPLVATFNNQSTNAISYLWNFGDGATDISTNPSHVYSANGTFEISLVATSDFGCVDSTTRSIQVIPTDLDIAVDYVETTSSPQADGTILISVNVYAHNEGTRLITDVTFYATIGSGGVISENWDTLIQSGESKYYLFNANFVVAAANANSYVCVEAKSVNNGEVETRIDNNRQCASVNGVMQVVGPSPNPARGSAYLGLILPKAGKVTIDIVDVLGRIAIQPEELDLPAGRTDYNLPVKLLRAGEYFIRLKHNDDKLLQKLVVH